jgi:hypothetical protein
MMDAFEDHSISSVVLNSGKHVDVGDNRADDMNTTGLYFRLLQDNSPMKSNLRFPEPQQPIRGKDLYSDLIVQSAKGFFSLDS